MSQITQLKKHMSRLIGRNHYNMHAILLVMIFAVVGALIIVLSHAATPTVSIETENGTKSANARVVTGDPTASNNSYVKFVAASPGGVGTAPGQQWNASNTGFVGAGVSESTLITTGSTTYNTDGQSVTGKLYTGSVTINANNVTISNCKVYLGGLNTVGFWVYGHNVKIQNCTIVSPSGKSLYEPVIIETSADTVLITGCDISKGENLITTYGSNVTISGNYLHDPSNISDTSGHVDAIEVYGGSNITIDNNRILELGFDDAPVNVAPYRSNNPNVKNLTVSRNFLDGGSHPILVDLQSSGVIQNTRIIGNVMGGHQYWSGDVSGYGYYHALLNSQNRPIVQTDAQLAANPNAIMWPTTAGDINTNYWGESQDLIPNKNGQIVSPGY